MFPPKAKDVLKVTDEQLALCTRLLDDKTGEVFYHVQSESDPSREPYEVHFRKDQGGFSCTCPAGQDHFRSCIANVVCKHCRWSVAHDEEYRALKAAEHEAQLPLFFPPPTPQSRSTPARTNTKKGVRYFGWRVRTRQGLAPYKEHRLPFAPEPPVEWETWKFDPQYDLVVLLRSGREFERIERKCAMTAPLNTRSSGFSLMR